MSMFGRNASTCSARSRKEKINEFVFSKSCCKAAGYHSKMKQHKNLYAILAIGALLLGGAFVYSKVYETPPEKLTTQPQTKTFQSKNLKFSIQISSSWSIEEGIAFINLASSEGKINVSRIATNFNHLSGYLKDFDSKRSIEVTKEKTLNIDGYNSIERIETFKTGPIIKQKVYFIYADGWIYSVSTSFEALFDDLDQIAQSFQYTP